MTRATLVMLAAAAIAASLACGKGENSLDGSLSEVFDLEVSTVHVLRNYDALVVSYEHNSGRDIDLVLRFTLALDQLDLQTGRTTNIAGYTDGGTLRATFLHNAAGEPARIGRLVTGDSYHAQFANAKHFGLGPRDKVQAIEVAWPNGELTRVDNPPVNQWHAVRP